jgi:hypothetical protein
MYEPAPFVSIIGLVILVLGILLMGLTLLRAGRAGRANGDDRAALTDLPVPRRRELQQQVRDQQVKAKDLPLLRAMAADMVARRAGLWFCGGALVAEVGILLIGTGSVVKLVVAGVLAVALCGLGVGLDRQARAGQAFLQQHPAG